MQDKGGGAVITAEELARMKGMLSGPPLSDPIDFVQIIAQIVKDAAQLIPEVERLKAVETAALAYRARVKELADKASEDLEEHDTDESEGYANAMENAVMCHEGIVLDGLLPAVPPESAG